MGHAPMLDSLAKDRMKAAKTATEKREEEKKKRHDKIAADNEKRERMMHGSGHKTDHSPTKKDREMQQR